MRSSLLIRAGMVAPVTIALPPTAGAQPPASANFLDAEGGAGQTLNRKFSTSPSLTTYSLPSARILPASLAPASPLYWMKSS